MLHSALILIAYFLLFSRNILPFPFFRAAKCTKFLRKQKAAYPFGRILETPDILALAV